MRTTAPRRSVRRTVAGAGVAVAVLASTVTGCDSAEPGPGSERTPKAAAPRWNTAPASVAAVGDSITRGFDACSVLADCPEVSWATGSDPAVQSLAARLLGEAEVPARSWNYAVTGSRMADLPGQLAAAAEHKPGLVTVMVGSNDACRPTASSMTPVAEFRAGFEQALKELRAASAGLAGVRVLGAGPPAPVGTGQGQPDGAAGLETGDLSVHARRTAVGGAGCDGPPGEGAGARGGVQRGAARGLREGRTVPLRRRGGVPVPLLRGAAEPLGLVPPGQGRAGAARGTGAPPGDGGAAPR